MLNEPEGCLPTAVRLLIELTNVGFLPPRTIKFTVGGRNWELLNRSHCLTAEQKQVTKNEAFPTGDLCTEAKAGEGPSSVQSSVALIARLLSLGLSRDVKDTQTFLVDDQNKVIEFRAGTGHLHPYDAGGSAPVGNYADGDLKNLLENGFPVLEKRPEWWHRTLDFFLQSKVQPYVDVQAALLNILMDRLSADLPANRRGGEIAEGLDELVEKNGRLANDLTGLMRTYLRGWDRERTKKMFLDTMVERNSRPSFAKGIQRLCSHYQVVAPKSSLLQVRHKLMHEGELLPKNNDLSGYVAELDSTITMLLLRMLNYSGKRVYVRKMGAMDGVMPPFDSVASSSIKEEPKLFVEMPSAAFFSQ
jgi:hypothetical protein